MSHLLNCLSARTLLAVYSEFERATTVNRSEAEMAELLDIGHTAAEVIEHEFAYASHCAKTMPGWVEERAGLSGLMMKSDMQ